MIDQITPLIITYNEAPNIGRVLEKLRWARRIVVIDSGSTDGTLEIVKQYPQVETFHRPFDTAADQCNFGLAHVRTEWVLSLDADYEFSDALAQELRNLQPPAFRTGYRASFVYRIFGKPLNGTLYPPRTVLYRVREARYINEGHTQRIRVSGEIGDLRGVIFHDDRKPLSRWFASQQRYARLEAEHLLNAPLESLSRTARIRRMGWPAPILVFFYVLFIKGCILDGMAGWYYTLQRVVAEGVIALELLDRRLHGASSVPNSENN